MHVHNYNRRVRGLLSPGTRTGYHDGVHLDSNRHEDIKMQLESNKDGQKLEAMKILIGVSLYLQKKKSTTRQLISFPLQN